ncbi:MAG TPA: MarR family transcriptional regulator [Gaiellaceae bacterium]|nr:MarR family transcriptional regulator [Gaiellaceae bacterium]
MEPRVSYLVGRLDRIVRRRLAGALEPYGLSLQEYTTLSVLHARSGLSNAQLARRSLITPQAMNEVLARLEQRGLVRRRPDPAHGRARPAELTAAGKRLLRRADGAVDAVEREIFDDVDGERLRELLTTALHGVDGAA